MSAEVGTFITVNLQGFSKAVLFGAKVVPFFLCVLSLAWQYGALFVQANLVLLIYIIYWTDWGMHACMYLCS